MALLTLAACSLGLPYQQKLMHFGNVYFKQQQKSLIYCPKSKRQLSMAASVNGENLEKQNY